MSRDRSALLIELVDGLRHANTGALLAVLSALDTEILASMARTLSSVSAGRRDADPAKFRA